MGLTHHYCVVYAGHCEQANHWNESVHHIDWVDWPEHLTFDGGHSQCLRMDSSGHVYCGVILVERMVHKSVQM